VVLINDIKNFKEKLMENAVTTANTFKGTIYNVNTVEGSIAWVNKSEGVVASKAIDTETSLVVKVVLEI